MAVMRLIDYLNLLRDVRRFFELQLLHQLIPSGLFMYSINGDETDFGKLLRKSKFICKFGGQSSWWTSSTGSTQIVRSARRRGQSSCRTSSTGSTQIVRSARWGGPSSCRTSSTGCLDNLITYSLLIQIAKKIWKVLRICKNSHHVSWFHKYC